MKLKLTTSMAAAAIALAPVAALAQGGNKSGEDSADMQKNGGTKVQKDTDARKNGASQSESKDGMNKNGQPQK